MERIATITLQPDNEHSKANVETGGVTNLEMLDMMKTLSSHFAKEVIKDYQELTGDKKIDPDKLDDYMKFLREAKL